MGLRLYNTLTRSKRPLQTIEPGVVRMYVCGPTVYDKAHIGHAMSSIVFDVVRRYLEYRGYQVRHVMNYTDVDDKVIRRASELQVDSLELAAGYAEQYDRHIEQLGLLPPTVRPRASQEIDQIIEMVQGLIEREHAYALDGDVYFEVATDEDYGKLSQQRLEDLRAGARLEIDERKRGPADFALWKAAKPGEPSWDSPWGPGRPGWHIECSAMNLHHLGEQIDLHGGGNDLIFPHHENEIAQSESLTGKPFASFWLHNGMMQLGGEAMSKSTGNVLSVDEFLAEYEPDVLRMLVLNSHYRSPISFSDEIVESASRGLERLRAALKPPSAAGGDHEAFELRDAGEAAVQGFEAAMDDDLNTPRALGSLFDLVRSINQARDAGAGPPELELAQARLRQLAGVLGLDLDRQPPLKLEAVQLTHLMSEILERTSGDGLTELQQAFDSRLRSDEPSEEWLVEVIVQARDRLRESEQWELADRIRDRLAELGIVLEDAKGGTRWRPG